MCASVAKASGVKFVGDAVSRFPNSLRQNGFGRAGKTDVLLKCDNRVAKKFPIAVHGFVADLVQVVANWEQCGMK